MTRQQSSELQQRRPSNLSLERRRKKTMPTTSRTSSDQHHSWSHEDIATAAATKSHLYLPPRGADENTNHPDNVAYSSSTLPIISSCSSQNAIIIPTPHQQDTNGKRIAGGTDDDNEVVLGGDILLCTEIAPITSSAGNFSALLEDTRSGSIVEGEGEEVEDLDLLLGADAAVDLISTSLLSAPTPQFCGSPKGIGGEAQGGSGFGDTNIQEISRFSHDFQPFVQAHQHIDTRQRSVQVQSASQDDDHEDETRGCSPDFRGELFAGLPLSPLDPYEATSLCQVSRLCGESVEALLLSAAEYHSSGDRDDATSCTWQSDEAPVESSTMAAPDTTTTLVPGTTSMRRMSSFSSSMLLPTSEEAGSSSLVCSPRSHLRDFASTSLSSLYLHNLPFPHISKSPRRMPYPLSNPYSQPSAAMLDPSYGFHFATTAVSPRSSGVLKRGTDIVVVDDSLGTMLQYEEVGSAQQQRTSSGGSRKRKLASSALLEEDEEHTSKEGGDEYHSGSSTRGPKLSRREKNVLACRRNRQKKRELVDTMQSELDALRQHCDQLQSKLTALDKKPDPPAWVRISRERAVMATFHLQNTRAGLHDYLPYIHKDCAIVRSHSPKPMLGVQSFFDAWKYMCNACYSCSCNVTSVRALDELGTTIVVEWTLYASAKLDTFNRTFQLDLEGLCPWPTKQLDIRMIRENFAADITAPPAPAARSMDNSSCTDATSGVIGESESSQDSTTRKTSSKYCRKRESLKESRENAGNNSMRTFARNNVDTPALDRGVKGRVESGTEANSAEKMVPFSVNMRSNFVFNGENKVVYIYDQLLLERVCRPWESEHSSTCRKVMAARQIPQDTGSH